MSVEPSACRHCGVPEREHMQRWTTGVGWHHWTTPTDEQRLTRMKNRRNEETAVTDAYTDHDEYMDDEDDQDEPEEWQPGDCDNCHGGDENGVTATGPLGPLYCACRIGQGATAENCRCGPTADGE